MQVREGFGRGLNDVVERGFRSSGQTSGNRARKANGHIGVIRPTFKAFRKRVATKLDKLDPDDLDNGLRNIKTDLVKEANDDARSAGGKITDGNIERLLWVSNTILDSLYRIHPELLRVEFPLERRRGIIAPEQIKALPDLCRVELTRIIMEDMKSTACDSAGVKVSEMAAAMALMFFGGLRTGEAVAPLVRDIVLHDRFAELFIAKRINDKGEMVEAAVVYARMTTYLKTTDEALCKAEILAKAKKLATKYHASIEGVSRTMPINPELHDMPTLVARHLTDYTKKKNLQGREADDTKSRLRTAAAKLYAIPLAEITPERLEKVQKSKEPLTKRQLKALEDYWYYCSDCFVTLQENPFVGASSFRNKKRKTAEEAATSNHLSEEQEADLDRKLLPLIEEDGCVLAIFLAKDGGISGSYCSKLKWKDIKFGADPRNVVIQIHRESAGATQNYSRPEFPTLALALRKRYERLLRDFTEEKLKGQHVIHLNRKKPRPGSKEERTWDEGEEDEPEDEEDDGLGGAEDSVSTGPTDKEGDKRVKKKKKTRRDRITRYIRETLIAKDVSYEVYLVVEADKDRENAVGTQILLNTYAVGHPGHALGHPSLLQLVVKGAVGVLESSVTVEQRMGVWVPGPAPAHVP